MCSKLLLLVYFAMFLQRYGNCTQLTDPEDHGIIPFGSVLDEEKTQIQNFSQPKAECTKGLFHTKPEFYDGSIFDLPFGEILETVYGITEVTYCLATSLLNPVLGLIGDENFCECDCHYGHAASEYEFCTDSDIPCLCIYTKEDLLKYNITDDKLEGVIPGPNSTDMTEAKDSSRLQRNNVTLTKRASNDTSLLKTQPENDTPKRNIENGREGLGICKTIFEGVIKLSCALIDDGGNPFYTFKGYQIFPVDICSIDCFFIHGAREGTGPYGQCCDQDGTTRCVCLY